MGKMERQRSRNVKMLDENRVPVGVTRRRGAKKVEPTLREMEGDPMR